MKRTEINFSNPFVKDLGNHIRYAASLGLPVVQQDCHKDAPGCIITGLSPSIESVPTLAHLKMRARQGWTIFAVKEGIGYLKSKGIPVHYACMMDPGDKEAARTPCFDDVTYCIASSCHKTTFDHLKDCKRAVFHSACGWPNEVKLYQELFGNGDTMIGGFTVCNRALGLAAYMGFKNLELAGVDFGRREGVPNHYASFVHVPPIDDVWMSDEGRVDGRAWLTRPDLLASAVTTAWMIKRGEVTVIGDSLANALAKTTDEFLNSVVTHGKAPDQPLPDGPINWGVVPIWPHLKEAA